MGLKFINVIFGNYKNLNMKFFLSFIAVFCMILKLNAQDQISYEEMKTFTKGMFEIVEFDSYLASDKHVYKIGDTIKFGRPSTNNTFAFLRQGNSIITPSEPVYAHASGSKTIIKKIYIDGTKRMGFKVYFAGKGMCGICPSYYIDVEQALSSNEIESQGMTKEKAIAKLKESKELFELGIISKQEYEKIKTELTPVITSDRN